MARVTRIERPTDLRPTMNGSPPAGYDAAWDDVAVNDPPDPERDIAPIKPPKARPRAAVGDPWQVFNAVALCLAITLLLNTKAFVKVAEAEPDGTVRSVLLASAHSLDAVASIVRLDRLNAWIDRTLNRHDEAPTFAPLPTPLATAAPSAATAVAPPPEDATVTAQAATVIAQGSPPAIAPTPTPPAPAGPRTITTQNPLRVYVAGDSFVEWMGYDFADFSKRDQFTTSLLDFKLSSGLARPDYFDWPARLAQAMAKDPRPEAVVWFSGANDYTDMRNDSGSLTRGTAEWTAEYGKRAAQVMDTIGKNGGQLYWVGQPIMRDKARSKVASDINTVVMAEAATRPWVHFIDIWSMFSDENGNYTAFLPDASGEQIRVRQEEGIHLTRTATTWVSERVYQAMQRDFKFSVPK